MVKKNIQRKKAKQRPSSSLLAFPCNMQTAKVACMKNASADQGYVKESNNKLHLYVDCENSNWLLLYPNICRQGPYVLYNNSRTRLGVYFCATGKLQRESTLLSPYYYVVFAKLPKSDFPHPLSHQFKRYQG